MILPYWKEIDFSQTQYDADWTSKKLEADPRYTESLKIFDRWCRRWVEYYRRKEINDVINAANEREKRRREQTRLELRGHLTKTFGDNLPDSVEKLRHATFSEVKKPAINADFHADWIDEELKESGIYIPEFEMVKSWLRLVAIEMISEKRKELEKAIREEEALSLVEDSGDAEFYDPLEMLDEAQKRDGLDKLDDCLGRAHKRAGLRLNQIENFSESQWKIVGKSDAPEELMPLYLTVTQVDGHERMVIEGYIEDDKWFHVEGNSLKGRGLKPIAWLPKDVPEPYEG